MRPRRTHVITQTPLGAGRPQVPSDWGKFVFCFSNPAVCSIGFLVSVRHQGNISISCVPWEYIHIACPMGIYPYRVPRRWKLINVLNCTCTETWTNKKNGVVSYAHVNECVEWGPGVAHAKHNLNTSGIFGPSLLVRRQVVDFKLRDLATLMHIVHPTTCFWCYYLDIDVL